MNKLKFSSEYGNYEVYFRFDNYASTGVTAVVALTSSVDPYAWVSVNMEHAPILPKGQFYLKDWPGTVEIAKAMIDKKLIEPVEGTMPAYSGYVVAHVYQFTEYGLKYVVNAQEYFEDLDKLAKETLKDLSSSLTNEEKTLHLVGGIWESILPKKYYYPPDLPDDFRRSLEHLATEAKMEWLNNVYWVFKYAESPIEKIFLNQLILNAIMKHSPRIIFTQPSPSANTMMKGYRANYQLVQQLWEEWLKEIGEDSPDAETEQAFVKSIQLLDINQRQKDIIIYNFTVLPVVYNIIHLTIQSTFDDILLEGKVIRPDILIWVPSNPNIKLIVECDGFSYHTSKHAFSNDRARDRLLLSHGFKVLRFSGHEITTDPIGIANEMLDYLAKVFQPFVRGWIPLEGLRVESYKDEQ